MNRYYPIFLDVKGRRCVVVGGGQVAERKVRTLLESEAQLAVVARGLTHGLRALVDQGQVEYQEREYRRGDLAGAFLAIGATDNPDTNAEVAREGREHGVLVNAVDDPPNCDFIAPSIFKRGDLVIAISTAGRSPAFARRLREDLDRLLSDQYLALFEVLAEVRQGLREQGVVRSGEAWHEAIDESVMEQLARGDREAARNMLIERLSAAGVQP